MTETPLRQMTAATIANDTSRTCTAVFGTPTRPGSLVVVIATGTEIDNDILFGPTGFTVAPITRSEGLLTVAVWYRANCPALFSVGVATGGGRDAMQIRALEYTGMAQDAVLDRWSVFGDNDQDGRADPQARSGLTSQTTQANGVVIGVLANRYGSTNQSGFTGGFAQLSNTLTPSSDEDYRRARLTVHHAVGTQLAQWQLTGRLTTGRDWIAAVLAFKSAATGPARMSSTQATPVVSVGGSGDLTAFGPLRSTESLTPVVSIGGDGRIGPAAGQIRIGGWSGLLVGEGTPYRIESIEGLGGQSVRISDSDLPRGAGAQRGIDLQDVRLVMARLNFHHDDPVQHERLLTALYDALTPQLEDDFPVMFRNAGRPLQQVWARPGLLTREQSALDMLLHNQVVSLRCANPRIYSATERVVRVPVTPAGAAQPAAVSAMNVGNGPAFPVIRAQNRDIVTVTTVELVNPTVDLTWRIDATLLPGAEIVGDMPSRVTAAGRSVLTVGGQPAYAAWVAPRDDFHLAPAPQAPDGANTLHLRTVPAGAQVLCTVTYPDTWAN